MIRFVPILISVLLLSSLPLVLSAQTADEIIALHIEAHGGVKNWDKVEALELKGSFTGFSIEKPFYAIKTRSGQYYADLYLGEIQVIEAFNDQEGWTIDPWQEILHARKLNKAEQNVFQQKATFFSPFYGYKEKGYSVEYMGLENIDGIEMHALQLSRSNGKRETWYLHPDTYLEYLCVSEWVDFAWASQAEAYFDDFREVDGLILPFYIDRTFGQRNRVLQLEELTVNPIVEQNLFDMPRKKEMEQLAFLEGEWNVAIEVMTRSGQWYNLGKTSSSIQFTSPFTLEERISYERILPIHRISQISFHDASEKYRVSVFNDLSGTTEPYEGLFTDSTFVFDNTGIQFDGYEPQTFNRVEIKKSDDMGFVLILMNSKDGGLTWNPTDRFSYTLKND